MLLKATGRSLAWQDRQLSKPECTERSRIYDISRHESLDRVGQLKSEEKVKMAIDMTEAMVEACINGIKAGNPDLTEQELMEELRDRFRSAKQLQRPSRRVK
jgi:hypothetical protein